MNQNQNSSNQVDMNALLSMLSKMDKKELQNGLAQVSKMLNTNPPKDNQSK